jgi:hypothetical protein
MVTKPEFEIIPVGFRSICNGPFSLDDIYDLPLIKIPRKSRIFFPRTGIFCDKEHEWLIWAHRYQSGSPAEWIGPVRRRGEEEAPATSRGSRVSTCFGHPPDERPRLFHRRFAGVTLLSLQELIRVELLMNSWSSDHNGSSENGNSVPAGMW